MFDNRVRLHNGPDPEEEREEARKLHLLMFGHEPPADPNEKCPHPRHAEIRRQMNGAQFDVPFDGSAVVSDESDVAIAQREHYGIVFKATQEFQREIEEEERWERMRELGLILPQE